MAKKERVHCRGCHYLKKASPYECDHEKNRGNWFSEDSKRRFPSEINKGCNCKWHTVLVEGILDEPETS